MKDLLQREKAHEEIKILEKVLEQFAKRLGKLNS